ncbi:MULTISPECIES: glycosyltransferase family 4 protein [Photorhabdus]|uniref:Glycosyltransferase n=1 Tax=Photorhabdus kayaii TaxID=230088 RepID=A0ABX0B108_9GAMM|nr:MULTISPECIES: glycosyltransferase family 4 protein [Photorhabdus]MCC8376444.1 glycosyltransferase family 4 protein [Photorhabdus bodei]MCT8351229.1 glycosyltransferase family 4 protein [Photorhabdus kayaii]MDB6368005.1 glycosyltransferase family 4 protein [Photorhabdus bodei]NDL13064.1 glycosyltransferase [Photorhabdus kayaii]NDL26792.1 glycosyltransferase [Photorhabdus kayaii]
MEEGKNFLSKKLKVLHLIQHMKVGGAQRALINIMISTSLCFEHIVVSTLNQYESELKELQIIFIDYAQKNIIKIIMEEVPDIIHYHWWPGFKMIPKSRMPHNCSVIVTMQDPAPVEDIQADVYVSGSDFIDSFQEHIGINKRIVIKSYIDIQQFILNREKMERVIIGRHSTIYENKIPKNYIANLVDFKLDAKFIIVGDGDPILIDKLNEEITIYQAQNMIEIWPGSKIREMLSICDIFLYLTPDDSLEGFANVISEAMVAGIPVIAEKKGGNPEQIIHGKTGFLCTGYQQARDFCQLLIQDEILRMKMGENAKKRGVTFDRHIMGRLYDQVYVNLAELNEYSR